MHLTNKNLSSVHASTTYKHNLIKSLYCNLESNLLSFFISQNYTCSIILYIKGCLYYISTCPVNIQARLTFFFSHQKNIYTELYVFLSLYIFAIYRYIGNPRVTPEVTRDVCLLARMMAANLYIDQIEELMFEVLYIQIALWFFACPVFLLPPVHIPVLSCMHRLIYL